MKRIIYFSAFLLIFFTANVFSQYILHSAFPALTFSSPVFLTHSGDGTNKIFIVQQGGLIKVFSNDSTATSSSIFLDVTARISTGSERGLLGLAFHPNFASNRFFYIYYTQAGTGNVVVARFTRSVNNPNAADSNSQLILITIPHSTYSNHNGGMLFFGLDGYLYFGTGDGGSGGDPNNNGQNVNVLLGKISRINVDSSSNGNNYAIPPTNPFFNGGGSGEIFTWGMRNPWRFTQDPVTGQIWCGDVGQNLYEEVDIIVNGHNYGWRIMEGLHCYNPPSNCVQTGLTLPIKEYPHNPECSIIGGYVYRGLRRPELIARYIYGDYCSGKIWKLYYSGGMVLEDQYLVTAPTQITSFGTDQNSELYVLCSNGKAYNFGLDPIGIHQISTTAEEYSLGQNYPNPFNPSTEITYSIPRDSHIKLSIYNSIGQNIITLVDAGQKKGTYKAEWTATNYPSGIYYYELKSDGYNASKKMVLVK